MVVVNLGKEKKEKNDNTKKLKKVGIKKHLTVSLKNEELLLDQQKEQQQKELEQQKDKKQQKDVLKSDSEGYIEVKPSTLPQVGLGVFATKNIPKGIFLDEYMGERLTAKEWDKRYPSHITEKWLQEPDTQRFFREKREWSKMKNRNIDSAPRSCAPPDYPGPSGAGGGTGMYGMHIKNDETVDAERLEFSNWTRYINSPFTLLKKRANVEFNMRVLPVSVSKSVKLPLGQKEKEKK